MTPIIVVHGGAGSWDLASDRFQEALEACRVAAARGQEILLAGSSALDAVEAAVNILEDAPVLDAGRGSYLNAAGWIEMDALIMDGATLDLGAVAAVQNVSNPISLARKVMESTDHNFLVAAGAEAFADAIGCRRCSIEDLLVGEELQAYLKLKGSPEYEVMPQAARPGPIGDTVGAVALDTAGNLAAATSTGGTRKKLPGRVGDSPLVGSGAYADNWTAAVSATGHGEALMKILISKLVCDFVANGVSAQKACETAIHVLGDRVNGQGGVIAVDTHGRIGMAQNTTAMPHAVAVGDGAVETGH
jgi:L-asparaginase / beta-aspartyl-peptidase